MSDVSVTSSSFIGTQFEKLERDRAILIAALRDALAQAESVRHDGVDNFERLFAIRDIARIALAKVE